MTGELTIFKTGAVVSAKFKDADLPTQRLDDGVSAGFGRISYKGSKWGIRYQGAYTPIQARMPDNTIIQSPFLDVVILRAAGHPNKAWYEGAYTEGDTSQPPDCWSSNGAVPDTGAPKRQSRTCVGCQHNVWGSKINRDTGQATRGKACMDSKRLAVVPVGDIENKMYGGPLMLSVPPSSLKRLGPYQNTLEANGMHYAEVWTRITFEAESAYPLFNFDAIAALSDAQADQVLVMVKHPMIDRILDAEMVTTEAWDESAQAVHSSIGAATPTPVTPSAPVAASGAQVTNGNDPGPMPPHLVRTAQAGPQPQPVSPPPATAPSPNAPPQEPEPDEPQAEQPDPPPAAALPAGVTLPPGMTPEMAAAFMAQFGATAAAVAPKAGAAPAGRGRGRKRTPPVSPATTDSAATVGLAGPALPQPVGPGTPQPAGPVASGPAPNGAGAADAVGQIMSTIGKLV
jgi:hypothetical protein